MTDDEGEITLQTALSPPFDEQAIVAQLPDAARVAPFIDFVMRRLLPRHHHSIFWGDRMMTLDKTMGFLDEESFATAWETVRGAHLYDQYDNLQSISWRLNTLVWAAREALRLPEGDLVECGVFQGDMSYVVLHAAGVIGSDRHFHLFDSFAGIDPAMVADGEYGMSTGYLEMANAHFTRPGLYESVLARFAPYKNVSVHKGFLPQALNGQVPDKIAWLHIDLNSAKAETETLEVLFDHIVPGGLIILDDYGWTILKAQKDAADKFFASRGHSVLEMPTGQGLVVKHARQSWHSALKRRLFPIRRRKSRAAL